MDQYPQTQQEKLDLPEFSSDREKTQFFADCMQSCQERITSLSISAAIPYTYRFVSILDGVQVAASNNKRSDHTEKYQNLDEFAHPSFALMKYVLEENLGLLAMRTLDTTCSQDEKRDVEGVTVFQTDVKYRRGIKLLENLAVRYQEDTDLGESVLDDTEPTLLQIGDSGYKELLNTLLSYIDDSGTTQSISVPISLIQEIVELSGKKSLYTQAADKIYSIVHRRYGQIEDEFTDDPKNMGIIQYVYLAEEMNPIAKRSAASMLTEKGVTMKEVLAYDHLQQTIQLLHRLRAHADSLQNLAQENVRLHLRDEVSDDDQVPSNEVVMKIISMMQKYNIPLPAISREPVFTSEGRTINNSDVFNLPPTELDWEVLPPGELESTARDIVGEASSGDKSVKRIDLSRLTILESIREMWGKDSSYYSRGVRNKRSTVRAENGEAQPDEYIVLVLQEINTQTGEVTYEHAVAESPIAGPNALYVYRQDATDHRHGWRSVMALPKKQSVTLGAKRIKHTKSQRVNDLNALMVSKVEQVITANPEDVAALRFNGVDKEGNIKIRNRRVGSQALSSY